VQAHRAAPTAHPVPLPGEPAAPSISLLFAREEYERAIAAMGTDYWSYGIAPNRHVLSAFARYAADQHLIARAPEPEDLFAPEVREGRPGRLGRPARLLPIAVADRFRLGIVIGRSVIFQLSL
jgi:hypothetical protein